MLLLVLVALVVVSVVIFLRNRDTASEARVLKRAGFALMAISVGFFSLFVVGETFTDPGGWLAVGLIALSPMIALSALAWYRPDAAVRVLAVLVGLTIPLAVWTALDRTGWGAFEDQHGPIRTIAVFALSGGVAMLGLKRTRIAGLLLLVLAVPFVLASLAGGLGSAALSVAGSPSIVAAVLFLASASLASRATPPGTSDAGPEERPEAA